VFQKAIQYWHLTCHNADGTYCDEAQSGSLQCVEFVTGVFASLGEPLPADGIGNGNQFWQLYQHRAGWTEIPAGGTPALGDIVAWNQTPDPQKPSVLVYGHLGIVVAFQAPTAQRDGFVTVADANAPGTVHPGTDQAGNFYRMIWHSDSYLRLHAHDSSQPDILATWPYFHVQGFIRHIG
jgi:surface antigen